MSAESLSVRNRVQMPDVTQILQSIENGDAQAAEKLLPLVYEELKKLAAAKMAAERADHTLEAAAGSYRTL